MDYRPLLQNHFQNMNCLVPFEYCFPQPYFIFQDIQAEKKHWQINHFITNMSEHCQRLPFLICSQYSWTAAYVFPAMKQHSIMCVFLDFEFII
jgi:hypothetical protein